MIDEGRFEVVERHFPALSADKAAPRSFLLHELDAGESVIDSCLSQVILARLLPLKPLRDLGAPLLRFSARLLDHCRLLLFFDSLELWRRHHISVEGKVALEGALSTELHACLLDAYQLLLVRIDVPL